MTEAEWLACTDPTPMLKELRGKASERKLRLFAVACCCRHGSGITDEMYQRATDVVERYADGLATEEELAEVHWQHEEQPHTFDPVDFFTNVAAWTLTWHRGIARHPDWNPDRTRVEDFLAMRIVESAVNLVASLKYGEDFRPFVESTRATEGIAQAALLHDIFGPLPFRPVAIVPTWLTWNHGTIPALARRIYENRSFEHMTILADALEVAGCTKADILDHCRRPGEHVRGCWVVDLILGKS